VAGERQLPDQTATTKSALSDIALTPIPEIDPAIPAIVLCVVTVLFAHLRKRRV
jgi:hypothetical protein